MIKDVTNTTHFIPSRQAKTGPQPAEPDRLTAAARQELNNDHPDETAVTKETIEEVVTGFNEFIRPLNTHLKFVLHEELNEYYVQVVDNDNNEVLREIPPKKLLDLYAAMAEYLGLLVDRRI